MTAAYGLPDHLIDLVGSAVTEIAVHIAFPGTELYELGWAWADKVDDGDHEGLLSTDDARTLRRVMKEVAEYVYSNPTDYAVDVAFALYADEILSFLGDIIQPERLAA